MKNERYTRAMDTIVPDADFTQKTLDRLNNKRRSRMHAITFSAAALTACALIAALVLNPFSTGRKTSETENTDVDRQIAYAAQVSPTPDVAAQPSATGIPNTGLVFGKSTANSAPDTRDYDADMDIFCAVEEPMELWTMPESFNTDEFSAIKESGFRNVRTSPLSTFAADVDTASYTELRRKLLNGEAPYADSIRIEEMLNYFSYEGLAPEAGTPIAISSALAPCDWNKDAVVLFVGIGAQKIETDKLPPANLVFLVDTSGSMDSPDRLDLIKQAFSMLTQNLRPCDTISIVTYAGSDRIELEGVSGGERGRILDAIERMTAYGSTNGSAGIRTAYTLAGKYFIEGGTNRVILMTDGDLNVGTTSEAALTELIEEEKQTGVFLSVYGFGMGNYKDNKLEALADHGNGNYAYIDSLLEAKRTLVNEMGAGFVTVAKDVKLQVEFNPDFVSEYRLIGYENRALNAEDFADDTKDGGEMGSGHTVVALYELIPAEGVTLCGVEGHASENGVELKYQTSASSGSSEIATVSVRAKAPDSDESVLYAAAVLPDNELSSETEHNILLSQAVAEFGMLLRNSDYRADASYEKALSLLSSAGAANDDETELMYLMIRAKQLQ